MLTAARPVSVRRPSDLARAPIPCSLPAFHRVTASFPRHADSLKISQRRFTARCFSEENSSVEDNELLGDIRDKWDAMENKSSLLLYAGGAIFALWLSAAVVRAVGSVPLLPDLLELVGLGYSGWFVYRYLLFQISGVTYEQLQELYEFSRAGAMPNRALRMVYARENRQELAGNLDALKKRITGNSE